MKSFNLKSVAIILIITIILCELTARTLQIPVFSKGFRAFDGTLGWKLSAGQLRYSYNEFRTVFIDVNPDGFRDNRYPYDRAPRTKRIAVIGDSFSEAFQVNRDQTFWNLLEKQLNENDEDAQWEVLNFGIGDFGTTQELLVLENEVWKYQPDIIILQTFPLNDIANNSLTGFGLSSPQDEFRPYLDPKTKYRTFTFRHPVRAFFRRQSEFFVLMENVFMKIGLIQNTRSEEYWRHRMAEADRKYLLSTPADSSSVLLNTFTEDAEQIPEIRQGWAATEAAFKLIADSCQKHNRPLLVATIPHELQIRPELVFRGLKYKYDPNYAERRIGGFFKSLNVPTINLLDSFRKNKDKVLPEIDGHLNEFGHQLLSKHLFQGILDFDRPLLLEADTTQDFMNHSSQRLFVHGFDKLENGISWTIHSEAKLRFRVDPIQGKNLSLYLKAKPFSSKNIPRPRTAEVFLNGNLAKIISMDNQEGFQEFRIPINLEKTDHSVVELEFKFDKLYSPKELNVSGDIRKLGFGVTQLRIEAL